MAPRSRRRSPVRNARKPAVRRSPRKRRKIDWSRVLFRSLIGIILIADAVLLFFVVRRWTEPPVTPEEVILETPPSRVDREERPLQIEVLNGCGVSGLAARFTAYLREAGFDVIKTDNYESGNIEETLVIERQGNQKNGFKVAEALGLSRSRVLQEVSADFLIDVTVILGRDFRTVGAWQDMENSGG